MDRLPSFELTGQVALVTGAARGLGEAIALIVAQARADVALSLRDEFSRGDVVERIERRAVGRCRCGR
jgi:NAD(P)-dependent dehydrogenase (short-subunit alcohol dehydrogenase family)